MGKRRRKGKGEEKEEKMEGEVKRGGCNEEWGEEDGGKKLRSFVLSIQNLPGTH